MIGSQRSAAVLDPPGMEEGVILSDSGIINVDCL